MDPGSRYFPNLDAIFEELNQQHFDGFFDPIPLTLNSRLRTSAGRFIPGTRPGRTRFFRKLASALDRNAETFPPKIEIAAYLLREPNAPELVRDTLGHEMIHLWLWLRGRPYGHTAEFYAKMRKMGVSRYNPVPRRRAYKWVYRCGHCEERFPARRRLARALACAKCCKLFSSGKYDAKFKLVLEGPFTSEFAYSLEAAKPPSPSHL